VETKRGNCNRGKLNTRKSKNGLGGGQGVVGKEGGN